MVLKSRFLFVCLSICLACTEQFYLMGDDLIQDYCECGCSCDASCSCGCAEGASCNCHQDSCECGCSCGASCSCGCAEGASCNCHQDSCECGCSCGASCSCGCSCGASCSCGCAEGASCNCDQSKKKAVRETDWGFKEYSPKLPVDPISALAFQNTEKCHEHKKWKGWSNGRCSQEYPKRCSHKKCADRYSCQAHSVYLGPYDCLDGDCITAFSCGRYGVWLPEDGLLFKPFIADPRQVTYSIGWRCNDQALSKNVISVSFGDDLAIYRWCSVWPWGGQMQIDLEGALWGVFNPNNESSLLNADYYVGVPISYAVGRWGFRLRAYHISSHIGDEFLLLHPGFDRRNPSAEYIDWAVSYYITDEIRFYSNIGWIVQHDDSFNAGKYYLEAGAELRLLEMGFYDQCQNLFGHPFFGMHFHYNNHYSSHIDNTYVIGYEWGKACGNQRRVRAFLEWHDGYSVDGQFRKFPTNYFSINMSYGY